MLGEPLLDVDGQAVAVVDLAQAVGLGEELQVAAAFLERPLAVLRLVEAEVTFDDVGDAEGAGAASFFEPLEDLAELLLRRACELASGSLALEQGDAPSVDVGAVARLLGGVPGTCGAGHECPPFLGRRTKEGHLEGGGW